MILVDVNVVVYAFDVSSIDHERYRGWFQEALEADEPAVVSDLVLSAFVRIVTHPKILLRPASTEIALAYADTIRGVATTVLAPNGRHWSIFRDLCSATRARGNLVSDAYHAALAIEHNAEFITTDGDFARFPGLRWRHPLRS